MAGVRGVQLPGTTLCDLWERDQVAAGARTDCWGSDWGGGVLSGCRLGSGLRASPFSVSSWSFPLPRTLPRLACSKPCQASASHVFSLPQARVNRVLRPSSLRLRKKASVDPRPLSLLQRGLAPRSKGKARAELRPARRHSRLPHSRSLLLPGRER